MLVSRSLLICVISMMTVVQSNEKINAAEPYSIEPITVIEPNNIPESNLESPQPINNVLPPVCGCNSCDSSCSSSNPLGINFSSDCEFPRFIEPTTNPIYSMDPRSQSRLRLLFLNQNIRKDSILGGGDFQVYAAQLSVALNERLSFIAQKDGWIELQAKGIPDTNGFGDIAAGLKYALIRNPCEQFILSAGFLLETSTGSRSVFQGNGNGMWTFFLTAGKEFGDNGQYHVVGTVGWNLPNHGGQETESFYYSLHLDRQLCKQFYLFGELNGIQYVDSGRRLAAAMEGGDLINLGANNVNGNSFISLAAGFTYRLNDVTDISLAHEIPVSNRKDLMKNRTSLTLSIGF